jgi:uncharacterized Fe-S cluster-containing radical SAM superfamily protein
MDMETTDDGDVRTVLTATVPDWAVTEAAVRVANADEPLGDTHVRELIDDQLNPVFVYETADGQAGVDAVREFAETLDPSDD